MKTKLDKVYTTFETEEKHLKEMKRMDKELVRVKEFQQTLYNEVKTDLQTQKYFNTKITHQQEFFDSKVKSNEIHLQKMQNEVRISSQDKTDEKISHATTSLTNRMKKELDALLSKVLQSIAEQDYKNTE